MRQLLEPSDDLARRRRDAVHRMIADLRALRTELDAMVRACPSGVIADCRILEALAPPRAP